MSAVRVVELFAGCGGAALGLTHAGWKHDVLLGLNPRTASRGRQHEERERHGAGHHRGLRAAGSWSALCVHWAVNDDAASVAHAAGSRSMQVTQDASPRA